MNPVKYLVDIDKDLFDILTGTHPESKLFLQKDKDEKILYLKSTIAKCETILNSKELNLVNVGWMEIEQGSINTLGMCYNNFVMTYNIIISKTYSMLIGWHCEHGNCYAYFENEGENNIFVSYFSDAHPECMFKTIFIPFTTNINKMKEVEKLPIISKNIATISDTIDYLTRGSNEK